MDHPNQQRQDGSVDVPPGHDRRQGDRRQGERRDTFMLGGRRHHSDRRRADRRMRLAGAGILASMAFAVGGHHVIARHAPVVPLYDVAPTIPIPAPEPLPEAGDLRPAWDRASLEPIIQEAAATHGLSPSLIRAVIQTESQFNPLAVSRVGAKGLMQLMPVTARHVGIQNPFDPRENVLGGTKYLSLMLQRFKGNTAKALAAYNAGPTTVARYRGLPPYRETQGYVRKIHKLVADTDAAFHLPASSVRKASLKSRSARKASVRKASARKAVVKKASARKAGARSKARTTRRARRG